MSCRATFGYMAYPRKSFWELTSKSAFRFLGRRQQQPRRQRLICLSRMFCFLVEDRGPYFEQYRLSWKDRSGRTNATYSTSAVAVSSPSTSLWGSVHFFEVNVAIDVNFGISSFVVDWAYSVEVPLTHSDNGGSGFAFQDVALYQADKSCQDVSGSGTTTAFAVVGAPYFCSTKYSS